MVNPMEHVQNDGIWLHLYSSTTEDLQPDGIEHPLNDVNCDEASKG